MGSRIASRVLVAVLVALILMGLRAAMGNAATQASATSVNVNANTDTALAMATENFDTENLHDLATANHRITAAAAGYYRTCVYIGWQANTSGQRRIGVRVNGGTFAFAVTGMPVTVGGSSTDQAGCGLVYLNAADWVETYVRHSSSTSPLTVTGWLTLERSLETAPAPVWSDVTGKPDFTALYCDADGTEADTDCGAGAPAWADVTGKPDFPTLYCDADGTEADSDCAGGSPDLSDYYTSAEVDGIAELASDTCGGPSLPACEVALSPDDKEAAQGSWWGTWAIVGLLFALILAPRWFSAFRVTHGA